MSWRCGPSPAARAGEAGGPTSDADIVALLEACRSSRDALIVLPMARAGLSHSEVCGLRRSDVHLLADSRAWDATLPGHICTSFAATTIPTGRGSSPAGNAECHAIS